MNKTTNKIALICLKPEEPYLEFLNNFTNYEVYIIIDDNSVNYTLLYSAKHTNLRFIQIPDEICSQYGFTNVNNFGVLKHISGWDKALYYLSLNFKNTDSNTKIWFIEDDVFFYDEETLLRIDAK